MPHLSAGGHRIEYQLLHPPGVGSFSARGADRPVLVFLHEGLGATARWKDFPAAVVQTTGCDALVYSRYGYGQSDRLTEARGVEYMHREALDVLPEILAGLSIQDPILVGHSDGASIALIHAGTGKWSVRGLVLMAPHVFVEDISLTSIAAAKVAFETTDLATKLGRYHDDPVSMFRGWNDIWLHPDFRYWNIEEYLPGVTCPVLLIQGEDDQYGTRAQVDAIARQVRGPTEILMLSPCGHSPHAEQREATLTAIAKFVDEVRR